MAVRKGMVVGIGNPLLDLTASVTSDFLEKYSLKKNDAILALPQHMPIFDDLLQKPSTQFIPGGATLNSIRVTQWLLRESEATSMFGCISRDPYGKILEEKCRVFGVKTMFQYNSGSEPTGKCAVLVLDDKRSLVTDLGSANCFKKSYLDNEEHWSVVEEAEFFYCAAFFLTVSPPSLMKIAEHILKNNKTLMLNLSAPFLCQYFKQAIMDVIPYTDIVVCNETEAAVFSQEQKFGTDNLPEIALKISALPKKNSRPRIVVVTCGSALRVIVAQGSEVNEFPVPHLSSSEIVDTNGAGDAFVGGFVSQFVQNKPLSDCVLCGIKTADCIIRHSGCTFPVDPCVIGY